MKTEHNASTSEVTKGTHVEIEGTSHPGIIAAQTAAASALVHYHRWNPAFIGLFAVLGMIVTSVEYHVFLDFLLKAATNEVGQIPPELAATAKLKALIPLGTIVVAEFCLEIPWPSFRFALKMGLLGLLIAVLVDLGTMQATTTAEGWALALFPEAVEGGDDPFGLDTLLAATDDAENSVLTFGSEVMETVEDTMAADSAAAKAEFLDAATGLWKAFLLLAFAAAYCFQTVFHLLRLQNRIRKAKQYMERVKRLRALEREEATTSAIHAERVAQEPHIIGSCQAYLISVYQEGLDVLRKQLADFQVYAPKADEPRPSIWQTVRTNFSGHVTTKSGVVRINPEETAALIKQCDDALASLTLITESTPETIPPTQEIS